MVGSHFDSMCRKNKEGVGVPAWLGLEPHRRGRKWELKSGRTDDHREVVGNEYCPYSSSFFRFCSRQHLPLAEQNRKPGWGVQRSLGYAEMVRLLDPEQDRERAWVPWILHRANLQQSGKVCSGRRMEVSL